MSLKKHMQRFRYLRHELRLVYLSFIKYRRGFEYLYMRFFVGPKIVHSEKTLSCPATATGVSMHFLTGVRDFTMALWSLASFYRYSKFIPKVFFHTDGTLLEKHHQIVSRIFPDVVFVDGGTFDDGHKKEIEAVPGFKKFSQFFPGFQSKKLVHTFVSAPDAYLFVVDSDLLWFRHPEELEHAFRSREVIMMDGGGVLCHQKFNDGTQTDDDVANLNSGVVGFPKDAFSTEVFEKYLERIDLSYTHHFVEQTAFAVSLPKVMSLPAEKYILKGKLTPDVVMRHYTSPSRAKFFFYGLNLIWKDILNYVRN